MTDKEIIALNLTAEDLSIDSEDQLFRLLSQTSLSNKIERSVYNRRKRALFSYIYRASTFKHIRKIQPK